MSEGVMPDPADDDYLVVVGLTAATFESLDWTRIRAAAEDEAEKVGAVQMKELFVPTASRRLAVGAVSEQTGHDPIFVSGVLESMTMTREMGFRRARNALSYIEQRSFPTTERISGRLGKSARLGAAVDPGVGTDAT